jgi:hypothetical protein
MLVIVMIVSSTHIKTTMMCANAILNGTERHVLSSLTTMVNVAHFVALHAMVHMPATVSIVPKMPS